MATLVRRAYLKSHDALVAEQVVREVEVLHAVVQLDALGEQGGRGRAQTAAPQRQAAHRHVLQQQEARHVVCALVAHPVARQVQRVDVRVVHERLGDGAHGPRTHPVELRTVHTHTVHRHSEPCHPESPRGPDRPHPTVPTVIIQGVSVEMEQNATVHKGYRTEKNGIGDLMSKTSCWLSD